MKWEYFIFNLLILFFPILSSLFYKKVEYPLNLNFYLANIVTCLIFIIHDIKVTGSWWKFNKKYILGFKLIKIPLEELMFFPVVAFSCTTIWLNLKNLKPWFNLINLKIIIFFWIFITSFFLIISLKTKKPYSLFTISLFIFLISLDFFIKTNLIINPTFFILILLVILLTFIFNFYLTKRPVVIYSRDKKSNINILTIPIEDFLYGVNFIYLLTIIYESLNLFR
ncbi:MAG: hypothetical protein KatS3mg091_554 [Patescibacteria group bacterium]|nr:MAG: hypothetical protein KatS3mg091_554 [Patescibacteria group bacterium]